MGQDIILCHSEKRRKMWENEEQSKKKMDFTFPWCSRLSSQAGIFPLSPFVGGPGSPQYSTSLQGMARGKLQPPWKSQQDVTNWARRVEVCVSPALTLLLCSYLLHSPISRKSLLLLYKRNSSLLCGVYYLQHYVPSSNNDINSPKLHCYIGSKQHCGGGICMFVKSDRNRYIFLYLWDLKGTIGEAPVSMPCYQWAS